MSLYNPPYVNDPSIVTMGYQMPDVRELNAIPGQPQQNPGVSSGTSHLPAQTELPGLEAAAPPDISSLLFGTTHQSLAVIDVSTDRYIHANSAFEAMSGWSRQELIGLNAHEMAFWDDPLEKEQFSKQLEANRHVDSFRVLFRHRDATVQPVWISGGYFQLGNQTFDSKRYLLIAIQPCSDDVREESGSGSEGLLLRTQRLEALGTLAGGIAHDFNNLLMAMKGNVSLLRILSPAGTEQGPLLDTVEKMIDDGASLTGRLLGITVGVNSEDEPHDLVALLDDELTLFARTHRNLIVNNTTSQTAAIVEITLVQMRQVLLNLLINAADALGNVGRIEAGLSVVEVDQGEAIANDVETGRYARILIADNGPGIEDDALGQIFEPFFTTKSEENGTGLGLSSVLGIVRDHGGFVRATSIKGEGACFAVYLPLSEQPGVSVPGAPAATEGTPLVKCEALRTLSGKVLLVDDDAHVLDVVGGMLVSLGLEVDAFTCGHTAIKAYDANPGSYDVVILDIVMAEMSGTDVLHQIRKVSPGQKAILCSGYNEDSDAPCKLKYQDTFFIHKPFSMEDLEATVSQFVKQNT